MRNQRFNPDGKVTVITDGGSGLGRAIATGFAGAGADLVISHVDGETCDD